MRGLLALAVGGTLGVIVGLAVGVAMYDSLTSAFQYGDNFQPAFMYGVLAGGCTAVFSTRVVYHLVKNR